MPLHAKESSRWGFRIKLWSQFTVILCCFTFVPSSVHILLNAKLLSQIFTSHWLIFRFSLDPRQTKQIAFNEFKFLMDKQWKHETQKRKMENYLRSTKNFLIKIMKVHSSIEFLDTRPFKSSRDDIKPNDLKCSSTFWNCRCLNKLLLLLFLNKNRSITNSLYWRNSNIQRVSPVHVPSPSSSFIIQRARV